MNEEKDIKSIKLSLPYVTEEGKNTLREMAVTFKRVIEKDKSGYNTDFCPTYSMGMSLVIPDHIHKKLVGATVGRRRGLGGGDNPTQYPKDFAKTITSNNLEALTERYREVIWDYRWLIRLDSMEVTKVIFYTFGGFTKENGKSPWDGKKMGSDTEVSYSYMIGYISNNGERLNIDKKIFTRQDGDQVNWKYVGHTDERELFFATIFSRFGTILTQLEEFEKKISPKTIDSIIQSGLKLLGN